MNGGEQLPFSAPAALPFGAAILWCALAAGCGYHVMSVERGPARGRAVVLESVDAARAVDAPVASALAEALAEELTRSGVVLAPPGAAGAARLSALVETVAEEVEAFPRTPEGVTAPSVTARVPGAYALSARLRLRLTDPAGAPLWDGTVAARAEWAEAAAPAEREASRARAERALAAALAERVREVLVR